MDQSIRTYRDLQTELQNIFDRLRSEIIQDRLDFIKTYEKWVDELLNELARDRSGSLQVKINLAEQKFGKLPQFLDSHSNLYGIKQLEKLIAVAEDLPLHIDLIQEESRFETKKEDSVKVRVGKSIKRVLRRIGHIFTGTSNRFRKLAGLEVRQPAEWQQQVPLRNLVIWKLVIESDWLNEMVAEDYHAVSEMTRELIGFEQEEGEPGTESDMAADFEISAIKSIKEKLTELKAKIKEREAAIEKIVDRQIESLLKIVTKESEITGTIEQSDATYKKAPSENQLKGQFSKLEELEKQWTDVFQSILTDFKIQTELASFAYRSDEFRDRLLGFTHELFKEASYQPLQKAVEISKDILVELKKERESGEKKQLSEIARAKEILNQQLIENLLVPMENQQQQFSEIDSIKRALSDLQLETRRFTEKLNVAEVRELSRPKPKLVLDEIEWRKLAGRLIKEEAISRMNPEKHKFAEFFSEQIKEAREATEVVEVNLEAALESGDIRDKEQSPLTVAIEGLERAINLFEKAISISREKQDDYEKEIRVSLNKTLWELYELIRKREFDKIELQDKALAMKSKAGDWKSRLDKILLLIREKLELSWRFFLMKGKKYFTSVSKWLGFKKEEVVSPQRKNDITEYLFETRKKVKSLPFVYQRLFDPLTEIDRRFYIAPENAFQAAESSFEKWKENLQSSIALIGEKNSGKSIFLRFLEEELFENEQVITVEFGKTIYTEKELVQKFAVALGLKEIATTEQLIQKINNKKKRVVLIVENLQNTYLRNIDGFEAQEHFWELMSQTKTNIFWIVSCSKYTWKFFDKIYSAEQYFSHLLQTDGLSEEQIRKGILTRHRVTGYNLQFEPGEAIKNSRTYRKLLGDEKEEQEYLMHQYFEKLAKIAEGNISIAMIFWIRSIKEFDDEKFIIMPIEIAELDDLETPSREVLFTLSSLVLHDKLNSDELSKALHQRPEETRLMLARLHAKGLLQKDEDGYFMNQLIYRQIIRALKNRNIIH